MLSSIVSALITTCLLYAWVWPVAEVILYYTDGKEFNWWSVIIFLLCTVIKQHLRRAAFDKYKESRVMKKSVFQTRLEAMARKNEENKKKHNN